MALYLVCTEHWLANIIQHLSSSVSGAGSNLQTGTKPVPKWVPSLYWPVLTSCYLPSQVDIGPVLTQYWLVIWVVPYHIFLKFYFRGLSFTTDRERVPKMGKMRPSRNCDPPLNCAYWNSNPPLQKVSWFYDPPPTMCSVKQLLILP